MKLNFWETPEARATQKKKQETKKYAAKAMAKKKAKVNKRKVK